MFPFSSTPALVCRPALPKDTPEVLELTRDIWGGEDYVPYVWDDWLTDPEGLLAVAEYGGRVAGLGKLTRLGPAEWWLEGLRVHPELQGRGIASHLHDYFLEIWQRNWGGILRLVTSSQRVPVHRMCARTGFQKKGEFTQFAAGAVPGETAAFRLIHIPEIPEALRFIMKSQSLRLSYGLIDLGWQWAAPSAQYLEEAIHHSQAWWWAPAGGAPRGLLAWREDDEEQRPALEILACSRRGLKALLIEVRMLARKHGYAQIAWMAPLQPVLLSALEAAGFQREWDDSIFLFEKIAGMV